MLEKVQICRVATYGVVPEILSGLKEINFFYGSNGTGKTTISRVLADCGSYAECSLVWKGGAPLEVLVYNRDFVERNFNHHDGIKGIFTLGEKDQETIDKIQTAKTELDAIRSRIAKARATLRGDNGDGGKMADLEVVERDFEARCWNVKLKHDERLSGAFTGFRSKKNSFKAKLLAESETNTSTAVPLSDIEKKAATVFGERPQSVSTLSMPDGAKLLAHEDNAILQKNVIGKNDVDIAALIARLGNSDWVRHGRNFYDPGDRTCPFCQQDTPITLEQSLNDYFDETFATDTAAISRLFTEYKADSDRLLQSVLTLLDAPSGFLSAEELRTEFDMLEARMRINISIIEEKLRQPSKHSSLESLRDIVDRVSSLTISANTAIARHNTVIANLESERAKLTGEVWRYILDHDIKGDLATFRSKKSDLEKAIANLQKQVEDGTREQREKEQEIRTLEKETTSIQPTIDGINALLQSFGFTGFALAKSDRALFYKLRRLDGSDVEDTLSEGERTFVSFLYFYHLLKGSESESGTTSDRVVVLDDPVSSLDSDILFIVSNLIKGLFNEVRGKAGTIKQVFVLTHNVYFHKEVSFNKDRCANGRLKYETFWTVRKSRQQSKIVAHESNPIKTSYELLWIELRKPDRDNLAIQNTMRRILENYFKILGDVDPDTICDHFSGNEKLLCRSLFSWVNDGSHFAQDSLYVSTDDSTVDGYLIVFQRIFEETGHIAHYNMMMGISEVPESSGGAKVSD